MLIEEAPVPVKKRKDPVDEKNLSLDDRVAFIKAKRLELNWRLSFRMLCGSSMIPVPRLRDEALKHALCSSGPRTLMVLPELRLVWSLGGSMTPTHSVARTSPTRTRLEREILLSWPPPCRGPSQQPMSAFLQGKEHDPSRTLWFRLPAEAKRMLGIQSNDVLMRLRKPIYGLVDAPRAWFREARDRLNAIGFHAHPLDQCLFARHDHPDWTLKVGLSWSVCLDFMWMTFCASATCLMRGIRRSRRPLKISLPSGSGMKVSPSWNILEPKSSLVTMGQSSTTRPAKYLSKLHPITVEKSRLADSAAPVTEKERTKLRALVGLQWAATQTSPHIQPHTSLLAGQASKATVATLQAANKALRFAKENSDVGLHYQWLGPVDDLVIVGYSDASFACSEDLGSQGGYLIR